MLFPDYYFFAERRLVNHMIEEKRFFFVSFFLFSVFNLNGGHDNNNVRFLMIKILLFL